MGAQLHTVHALDVQDIHGDREVLATCEGDELVLRRAHDTEVAPNRAYFIGADASSPDMHRAVQVEPAAFDHGAQRDDCCFGDSGAEEVSLCAVGEEGREVHVRVQVQGQRVEGP